MFDRRGPALLILCAICVLLLSACSAGEAANDEVAASEHDEAAENHDEEEAADDHEHESHVDEHEEDHAHTQTTHDAIEGAEEIRVVAKEWGFEPASIHLHEGEAVNIVLVNEGVLEHEIELGEFDFHIHAQPGETTTAGFEPDKTGEFKFACFVPGHYDAGMVGDVIVEHAH